MHHSAKLGAFAAGVLFAAQPLGARVPDAPALPSREDAPIAYLVDATSGQVLFAREPDRRFMPASITKVMTTFLAFEWMEEGRIRGEQILQVRPETWARWHNVGSTMFLPANARVSVDTLLHGITTVSANDGAAVLAQGVGGSMAAWTAAMNAKARDIGMADSHFATANGWMDEGQTFVTARDLVTLGRQMVLRHPAKYRHFVGQKRFRYNNIEQVNHDPITGVVPGADGIKTGFTNQAGYGFLGSAERGGRRLMMVVAGSPRGAQRNKAARGLIEWGFAAFDSRALIRAGATVASAEVQDGSVSNLSLRAPRAIVISVPRGTRPEVAMRVRYQGPLKAPIAEGTEVAELVITVAGQPSFAVPLVADSDVMQATALQRVFNGFAAWLP